MSQKNERNLKVCAATGYKYKYVPQIQLKGVWLRQYGFTEDTPVTVVCEDGKLIITPQEAPAEKIPAEPLMSMVAERRREYHSTR